MSGEEFIKRAKIVHANEGIDYSEVVYVNNRTKVKLIDPEYGEFWQTPYNHLRGQSHPKRRGVKISKSKSESQDKVIDRFKKVHSGEGLDYSKVQYINMHTKVCIIDPEYGEFWQEPAAHLKGCIHPRRAIDKNANSQRYTTEKFIELCKKVHPDYIYDKVAYQASQEKVCIVCPKHGEFYSYPDALLQGKGCPKCGNHISKGEDEVYKIACECVGENNVVRNDKSILGGLEIDILVKPLKIGFEFDGLLWHSEKYKRDRYYHLNKTEKCNDLGITLIHVFEDEWLQHKEIVLKKIKNILGCNEGRKISARKCEVRKIKTCIAKEFLAINHIQGFSRSSIYLGGYYNDELVAVMSFIGKDGTYELNRFATCNNYIVRGIGGKMFSYFISEYSPLYVKSFLDRRWCVNRDDNLYTKIGFKLENICKPNYSYTDGHSKRFHKFRFRKKILHKKYGFPLSMTESEMASKLGYVKIYDCGLFKYVWRRSNDVVEESVALD